MKASSKRFQALPLEEELQLLRTDNQAFERTRQYLLPLIESALSNSELDQEQRPWLIEQLLSDVPLAARRFLANHNRTRSYRFATYFTWYIAERLRRGVSP